MNIGELITRACDFEGFRHIPYKDTADPPVWTHGFGATQYHGRAVTAWTPPISKAEALVSMKASLLDSIATCHKIYPNWRALNDTQQEVLIHMAFQIGQSGLRRFKLMNKAVAKLDIDEWAKQMTESLWAKQTPRVYTACHNAILNSKWKQP